MIEELFSLFALNASARKFKTQSAKIVNIERRLGAIRYHIYWLIILNRVSITHSVYFSLKLV